MAQAFQQVFDSIPGRLNPVSWVYSKEGKPAGLPVPNASKSFWHSEPNEFLIGHKTTEELPEYSDVVIVGSGITGASAARFLAEDKRASGMKVVMLEAREACWGATGRNGGHCQPLLFDRGPDVAHFELKNYDAVRSYIAEHNVPCEWRTVQGCRTLWSKDLFEAVSEEVRILKEKDAAIGEKVTLISSPEELKKERVSPDAAGATLTRWAGSLWPYKYVAFILEKLIKDGKLNLQTKTPVNKIAPFSSLSEGNARWSLQTNRGSIKAKHVVLATNGYTSHLLHSFKDLIVPVRGEMSAQCPPKGSTMLPNSYGFVGALGGNPNSDDDLIQRPYEGVPNPAGHLMFGGGRTWAKLGSGIGEYDDNVVDQGSAQYLRKQLLNLLILDGETEGLEELKADYQWTGIMGYSRDNQPWVGQVPGMDGVWMSAGYTGHGMPNGTLCGKAAVDMLLASEAGTDLEQVQKEMVRNGDLPQGYLLTSKRLAEAAKLPFVSKQDEMAFAKKQWAAKMPKVTKSQAT